MFDHMSVLIILLFFLQDIMLALKVKEHPMFYSLVREFRAAVADQSVSDETHVVSFR